MSPSASGFVRRRAERAAVAGLVGRLVAEDVGHPVRGPQPLEAVLDVGEVVRRSTRCHSPCVVMVTILGRARRDVGRAARARAGRQRVDFTGGPDAWVQWRRPCGV